MREEKKAASADDVGPSWEALHHAWMKIGADVAGLDWGAFTNAVHYAPTAQAALLEALKEAQAGLEFAAARLPHTTGFVPSHIAALNIVNAALAAAPAAQAAPACKECEGTGTVAGSQAHFACPQCKAAPAAVKTDPCPGCMPGGYCKKPSCGRLIALNAAEKSGPAAVAGPSLYQVMAVAKAIHATTPDADDWDSLRQWEVDALRRIAEKVLAALAAAPAGATDPWREHLADQADMIDCAALKRAMVKCGISFPDGGMDHFRAALGEMVNRFVLHAAPQPAPVAQGDAPTDTGPISRQWLTVVYRGVEAGDEVQQICTHPKVSAMSWSHALHDRDAARAQAKEGGA